MNVLNAKYNTFGKKNKIFLKHLFFRPIPLGIATLTGVSFCKSLKKLSSQKGMSLNKESCYCGFSFLFLLMNYMKDLSLNTFEKKHIHSLHFQSSHFFFLVPSINFSIDDKYEFNFIDTMLKKLQIDLGDYDDLLRSKDSEIVFGALICSNFNFLHFSNYFNFNNGSSLIEVLDKFITYGLDQGEYKSFFDGALFATNVCKDKKSISKRLKILITSAVLYAKKNSEFNFIKFKDLWLDMPLPMSDDLAKVVWIHLGKNLFEYTFFKDFAVYFFVRHDQSKEQDFYKEFFSNLFKNLDKEDIKYILKADRSRFERMFSTLSEEDKAKLNQDIEEIEKEIEEVEKEKEKLLNNLKAKLKLIYEEKNFDKFFNLFRPEDAINNLKKHMICPLDACKKNNQACALSRVYHKIDNKKNQKTDTEKKFNTVVAFINELVLCLDAFICSDIQLTSARNVFGISEDDIVLQLGPDVYCIISYSQEIDQVVFRSGEEISLKEIEKIKGNGTQWY